MKKIITLSLLLLTVHFFACGISAQTEQKAELVVQLGHSNIVGAAAFSPDGRYIVTGDGIAKVLILWETASGKELRRVAGHDDYIVAAAFSHDGQFIASVGNDKTLRKWEVSTGRELLKIDLSAYKDKIGGDVPLDKLAFGSDDLTIIASVETNLYPNDSSEKQDFYRRAAFSVGVGFVNPSMQIWSAVDGALLKNEKILEPLAFSSNGKLALVWRTISVRKDKPFAGQYLIWDLATHRPLNELTNENVEAVHGSIASASFSPDGATLSTLSANNSKDKPVEIILWNVPTGRHLRKEINQNGSYYKPVLVQKSGIQKESHVLFFGCPVEDKKLEKGGLYSICSLDLETGEKSEIKLERFLGYTNRPVSVSASADKRLVAFGTLDGTTTIINVSNRKIVSWLTGKMPYVTDVGVGADGASISIVAEDETKTRWDLIAGEPVVEEKGKGKGKGIFEKQIDVASPDGKLRVVRSGGDVVLRRAATGEELFTLEHPDYANSAAFSPDNTLAATGDLKGIVRLWSVATGKVVKTFAGHSGIVYGLAFMPDGKTLITGSMDSTTRLWNVETAKEKARLITAFDGSWTVITPDGLFDASPEARKLMHYVVNLEIVTLEQMKDIYYVPGLLKKIIKDEPLPKVELFSKKDLFPAVEFSLPKAGQKNLTVKLINRGGGIGQVQILVNGKELVSDARPAAFDANAKEATLVVNLKDAPLKGKDDKIEVIVRNAAGSLTNRGTPRGSELINIAGDDAKTETPHIYAIVGGISDYTGGNLKLNYAAKDAEDFAKAIEIGATKLLGDESKIHIRLLTSNGDRGDAKFTTPDASVSTATKADFNRAFADFKNAAPNDVFIVYLAGHGVSLNLNQNPNQAGGDTYLYLTQEATTSDKSVLAVENSRRAMTVSSEELKDLMKQNKALKQVLILDTCAAGQIAPSLIGRRDLPSDQIRAIERLKDNTGFFVLMGSAADSVSYEASQYGQGLLTYSLLQGMKGARLRENQFADIGLLFEYAQENVPQMAKNIGGIQQPRVITPDASRSFDIGKFTPEEQKQISLAAPKPIILRPNLRNAALRFDNLKLTQMMTEQLREISYARTRGAANQIVFVEAEEMTDAVLPSGDYSIEGDRLKISVILVKNNALLGKEIIVTGHASEAEQIIKQLVEAITQSLRQQLR